MSGSCPDFVAASAAATTLGDAPVVVGIVARAATIGRSCIVLEHPSHRRPSSLDLLETPQHFILFSAVRSLMCVSHI